MSHTNRTTQQLLAEFWTLADRPLYSLDLKLLDFSISSILQVKVQAMPHANLETWYSSIAMEQDWLGV
jgi:hypothetical protein